MQLVAVLLGALAGLIFGYMTGGFHLKSEICLFAGLTLIMPSLFKVNLSDIRFIGQYRGILLKSLFVNFCLLPIIAVLIGLFTHDFGVAAGIFLLSVLGGGGMVLYWIKKTDANTSLGFLILLTNLLLIPLSVGMLHLFGLYTQEYYSAVYRDHNNTLYFMRYVLKYLIIYPFLLSRIVMMDKPLVEMIERYRFQISTVSIFIIVFYLFALDNTQKLVEIYRTQSELFLISLVAVIVFYLLTQMVSRFMYDLNCIDEKAAYWHTFTRYITLALIISLFAGEVFGASMLIPIMFAYVIQIPAAIFLANKMAFPPMMKMEKESAKGST